MDAQMTFNYEGPFEDIKNELDYAVAKWGTEFDSKNTLNDWITYSIIYLGRAGNMNQDKGETRRQLVKAAGLVVSAIEWLDSGNMPKRHYDKEQ